MTRRFLLLHFHAPPLNAERLDSLIRAIGRPIL
jgi:hypothetical protein